MAVKVENRLTDANYGLIAWADRLFSQVTTAYQTAENAPPHVNGYSDFHTAEITTAYEDNIKQAKAGEGKGFGGIAAGEGFAMRQVVSVWDWIAEELVTSERSAFDEPTDANLRGLPTPVLTKQYKEVRDAARSYFMAVLGTNVAERLARAEQQQRPRIEAALIAGRPRVNLQFETTRNTVKQGMARAAYEPKISFLKGANDAHGAASSARAILQVEGMAFAEFQTPYRIGIAQARNTFSISMISGLCPEENLGEAPALKRHFMNEKQTQGRHFDSRKDVRWKNLETSYPFAGFTEIKAYILVALASNMAEYQENSGITLLYNRNGKLDGRLNLGKDLDDATYTLHEHAQAEAALRGAVREKEKDPQDLYPELRMLWRTQDDGKDFISRYRLTDKAKPLTGKMTKDILLSYVLTVPGLAQRYQGEGEALPRAEDYLKPIDPNHPERGREYVCPGCGGVIQNERADAALPRQHDCGYHLLPQA